MNYSLLSNQILYFYSNQVLLKHLLNFDFESVVYPCPKLIHFFAFHFFFFALQFVRKIKTIEKDTKRR